MKKIMKSINKHFEAIATNLDEGRWLLAIIKYIITLAAMGGAIVGIIMLCQLVYDNVAYIIFAVVGFLCLVALFRYCFPARTAQPEIMPQAITSCEDNVIMYDTIFLENTYHMLLTNICPIIAEKADILNIYKPMAYYELEAPIHYTVKGFVVYHFLMGKNGETVDTQKILQILQDSISKRLDNSEMVGISKSRHLYNGYSLPSIMIDSARDLGNFIQVDIVITCDTYCQYRMQRLQSSISNASANQPRDRDF